MTSTRTLAAAAATLAVASGCYAPEIARHRTYHPSDAELSVTRVSHASVVLEFAGTRILADPWYSPFPPFGHAEKIGIPLDVLPPMTGVLITSGRRDHFDPTTLDTFPDKLLRVVVPGGLGKRVRALGFRDVVELDPWEQTSIGDVTVHALPGADDDETRGFVLENAGIWALVAGSLRFDPRLLWAIKESYPELAVALLPIGGNRLGGFLVDMTPEQAAKATAILGPDRVIPYHYGLVGPFPLLIRRAEPVVDFLAALEGDAAEAKVVALGPGESWHHYR